jgi:3',5'-cyclic AMP phosphodiesterase CpdA
MKTLAHISDVHFGREDPALVDELLSSLANVSPDLMVVSGDLTQRARKKQFKAARAFLRELPDVPRIVVPGNHDVSTTNLWVRATRPLERYKRYITTDLSPFHKDDTVAIAGINTVRLLSTKDGRINARQVAEACAQLSSASPEAIRVVVTHHPMDLPAHDVKHALVTRAGLAMKSFAQCKVDLFLSGHLHGGLSLASSARYPIPGYSAIVAHAGTAVSTRTRKDPNAWNLIHLDHETIAIHQMEWTGRAFKQSHTDHYKRTDAGWVVSRG